MSEINKVNKGFSLMLPRAKVEEVKYKKCYHELKLKFFGYELRFVLDFSRTTE